jgi:hypothetical protein
MRWLLILCLGLLLAAGCGEDAKRTLTPPTIPDYLANDSPDNLIANLVMALEAMDSLGYAALLYDGVELATDGQAYAAYKFYYDRTLDPHLPELDLYDRDLERMGAMLGGAPGEDGDGNPVPGVRGFDLLLAVPTPNWAAPIGPDVDDDAYPVGTVWRIYDTSILITLKSNYGTDTNGWSISDRLLAHCIPVQVGGETEYRLWKWREIVGAKMVAPSPEGTEDTTLGMIKVFYGD